MSCGSSATLCWRRSSTNEPICVDTACRAADAAPISKCRATSRATARAGDRHLSDRRVVPIARLWNTGVMEPPSDHPDWDELELIRQELIRAFAQRGVSRVEFTTAFSPPFGSAAWLGTTSDDQRDRLLASSDLLSEVHAVLRRANRNLALIDGVTAQSQQTVDRDYDGSWFYALR